MDTLNDRLKDYIESKKAITILNNEIKELMEESGYRERLDEIAKQTEEVKNEMASNVELNSLKDRAKELKEHISLISEIVVSLISEQQLAFANVNARLEFKGYEFSVVDKLKVNRI